VRGRIVLVFVVVFCQLSADILGQDKATPDRLPNIVLVFTDDQGWGDLSCFGSTEIPTPEIDRLAAEGMRFSSFYAAQPVCSASRASLLTGCYANRIGVRGAYGPNAKVGLSARETTIAEMLKPLGYRTAIFGKWHLGHLTPFLPTQHGFDTYFGIPYSNDMWPGHPESPKAWAPLPWYRNNDPVAILKDHDAQEEITERLTVEAVNFIQSCGDSPFFLYVPHSMPHVPLGVSAPFRHRTPYGMYGDVIREIDASVGRLRSALEESGVLDDTIFIFTSDNGPWLSYGDHAGTTGGLREGKGTTFEGGVRVPFVIRDRKRVPAGSVCDEPSMTIDILPTIAEIVGADLPELPIDGKSLLALFEDRPGATSPHDALYFWYHDRHLEAMRSGRWKLHFPHRYRTLPEGAEGNNGIPAKYNYRARIGLSLFDLESDRAESMNVAEDHPEVLERLMKMADEMRAKLGDKLQGIDGSEERPIGTLES